MTASKPHLMANRVSKALGSGASRSPVVLDASIALDKGELIFLMGPSGSGKTTLLSMLGCIMRPDSGEIIVAGERANGLSQSALADLRRRHIGYVFQAYNLFPGLTAAKNVQMALAVRGYGAKAGRAAAESALATVGLAHKLEQRPTTMSGGEQQRVAIARAIAGTTSVLLADEPTAALDSKKGREVMELLQRLARESERLVLVVTHDTRLLPYADRVFYMRDGQIFSDDHELPTQMNKGAAHAR
jgi:putative ABC transport system ATP-binding protein